MNAPAYQVVRGQMVREVELQATPRMEQLLARALELGHSAGIVESDGQSVLVISVYDGAPGASRFFGTITVYAATETEEERWHLSASCNVMAGLPMQADWLPEGAKRVREVFTALVTP